MGDRDRLRAAVHAGRRDDVVELLRALPLAQRRRLQPVARAVARPVLSAPTGARSEEGEWTGELTTGHWSAAVAATLGCSHLEQAVTVAPLDPPDSYDLPLAFFPDDLAAFAQEWCARFLRNPRAWDRLRGIQSVFDWAHAGLIEPPTSDGAVLFLVSRWPGSLPGRDVLAYLEARPVLVEVTLRRIFDVAGRSGASLAQIDPSHRPGDGWHDFVVPELVRRGHWTRTFVDAGIARALGADLPAFQRRWFVALAGEMARLDA